MNYAVRYYTKTGNTKKLADAVAKAVGVEALPISSPVDEKVDIKMDEREFHCKGEFKGVHKGRPNEDDLKAAAEFAKGIAKI